MSEFSPYTQLEGLERVSILISILDDRLGFVGRDEGGNIEYDPEEVHPAIHDKKSLELLARINHDLIELYNHIGAWGLEEELKSFEKDLLNKKDS